jgi:hypothetical protein
MNEMCVSMSTASRVRLSLRDKFEEASDGTPAADDDTGPATVPAHAKMSKVVNGTSRLKLTLSETAPDNDNEEPHVYSILAEPSQDIGSSTFDMDVGIVHVGLELQAKMILIFKVFYGARHREMYGLRPASADDTGVMSTCAKGIEWRDADKCWVPITHTTSWLKQLIELWAVDKVIF